MINKRFPKSKPGFPIRSLLHGLRRLSGQASAKYWQMSPFNVIRLWNGLIGIWNGVRI